MKHLTDTRFFLLLKGNDSDTFALEREYDSFVMLLFSEGAAYTDRAAYRNSLVYTRAELSELAGVSGEKTCRLSLQSH